MKQKYYKGFTQVNKVLPDRIKEYKLQTAFYRYQAMKFWKEAASAFVTEAISQTKAVDFKKGILIIACLSKEIAYQLKLLANRIVYELNKLIGKQVVYAVQIEV